MVAVRLLYGHLTTADYEDKVAQDSRMDPLRAKIACVEAPAFTAAYYHDPAKRSITNALTVVEINDGEVLDEVVVEYPVGHARRRSECIPLLEAKFGIKLVRQFPEKQQQAILHVSLAQQELEAMPAHEHLDLYVI